MIRTLAQAGVAALLAVAPFFDIIPGWTLSLATVTVLTALSLIGLNLIFGVVGMLAFGQAAFMALPAYVSGVLVQLGAPLLLGMAAGILGTIAIARAVAEIFVRLPGVYFAVGTLGFGFVVEGLARAFPSWTGGASGLVITLPVTIGVETWYLASLAALALALFLYAQVMRGHVWRRLRTIRHDELAAAVLGIDVARSKARAFTIGSAFAAVAGMALACYVGVLVPENAGVTRSFEQVGSVIVGGLGTLWGPVVGAVAVQWLFVVSGYAKQYEVLIYGVAFLGAVIYAPHGIVGLLQRSWPGLRRPRPASGDTSAPTPLPADPEAPATRSRPREGVCLEVRDLAKRFGGVTALDGVSFDVRSGEIFTIIGPNGAGKTTLFNLISGVEQASAGRIALLGAEIAATPIHRRAPLIGRSFQVARLVPELTATQNVMVRLDQIAPRLSEAERMAAAVRQLDMFGLGHLADRPASQLALGQHKLVDLARATVGDPPLVLLDEPAVGLTQDELAHLARLLTHLKACGCAIIIVEHNIEFIAHIAERGIVLDSGQPIALGAVAEILADPRVREAYFGVLA